ncbi:uncharacterized protein LOC132742568 [Ruditapes philippinarum]|uniref:uncharacterized protein LOC132742568 n=1 Tax=Ruditapes philippinarum TaxID=129788 RepID=UPI00295B7963|nr:uncharacterized protein LOC132742568 [Ruditapes philippinarum]
MDFKLFLLAFVLLNEVWFGNSCRKSRRDRPKSCPLRKQRSTDSKNMIKTGILRKIGTQLELNLTENPCVFQSYDFDGDGLISKDELESKIGVKKGAKEIFALVFSKDDDGPITLTEFCMAIPHLVSECTNCYYDTN